MDAESAVFSVGELTPALHAELCRVLHLRYRRSHVSMMAVEDAVSEAFLRALIKQPVVRSLRAWCTTVAQNRLRDSMRVRDGEVDRRRIHLGEHDPDVLDVLLYEHGVYRDEPVCTVEGRVLLRRMVRDHLRAMPKRMRQVLVLRYRGNLNYVQIAARLRVEHGAAKMAGHRAHRWLLHRLTADPRLAQYRTECI